MLFRPKRKATINKSYNDTIDESVFEEKSTLKKKKTDTNEVKDGKNSSQNSRSNSNSNSRNGSVTNLQSRSGSFNNSPIPGQYNSNEHKKSEPKVPLNWQPIPEPIDYFSNKLDLTNASLDLDTQTLSCPNQSLLPMNYDQKFKKKSGKTIFQLKKGDYIYMISEPPGEPYYIGRIMSFKSKKDINNPSGITSNVNDFNFQIQWFYRPRDISRFTNDSRLLYASMHTDTCPLNSFRGITTVTHRQEIENFDQFVKLPNHFYFEKLYDRYMMKFYDILSTSNLLDIIKGENGNNNKSKNFLIALNKRFEFIFVESQATKFLINAFNSNSCTCEICGQWCSTQDSVDCISCGTFYHLFCLDPPLLKKPSRGFSWTCAICTKKHDQEYKNKKMIMLSHDNKLSNEKDLSSEVSSEDEESVESTTHNNSDVLPKYELMAKEFLKIDSKLSLEERRLQEEWCMRYLGLHSKLEDGVDLDDRSPYPRASTRIGAKHQATYIPELIDHPLVYYDKPESSSGNKKAKGKSKVQEQEEVEPLPIPKEYEDTPTKDLPQWLQPRPKGYIERGEDDGEGKTCSLLWKPRDEDMDDDFKNLDKYIEQCKPMAEGLQIHPNTPNFVDAILYNYYYSNGDVAAAINKSSDLTRKSLNEPTLTAEEVKVFEEGVKQNGSELYPTYKLVKTQPCSMIVRFYYIWKKTRNGKLIWGNYEGRLKKKTQNVQNEESQEKLHLFIDDDESGYDDTKTTELKKTFSCKHCDTSNSIRWFRLTGFDSNINVNSKKKENPPIIALCFRCARLWRRYAVVWEDPNEIDKRINKSGNSWKKKIEFELLRDSNAILSETGQLDTDVVQESKEEKDKDMVNKAKKQKKNGTSSTAPVQQGKKPKKEIVEKESTPTNKKNIKQEELESDSKPKSGSKKKDKSSKADEITKKREFPDDNELVSKKIKAIDPEYVEELISPFRNKGYEKYKSHNLLLAKQDKQVGIKLFNELITKSGNKTIVNTRALEDLVKNFRANQLSDLASSMQYYQLPLNSSIELPFDINSRGCCICNEKNEIKSNDMLICSNCGVNVHSTCLGMNINAGIKRPVKEWLCDCCVNDLKPTATTIYSCCLCLANETNFELSILGSKLVRPDLLKPIHDDGRWCHLLCALFSYKDIDFNWNPSLSTPNFRKIHQNVTSERVKQKFILESLTSPLEIHNVSRIFVNNISHKCTICGHNNGCLVPCMLCEDDKKCHVSCAEDTPDYKIGFRLLATNNEKDSKLTKIGDKLGHLEPTIICNDHGELGDNINFYTLRHTGKRNQSSGREESKPLIQLFIEDLVKGNTIKLTGPQKRASNYLDLIQTYLQNTHNSDSSFTDKSRPKNCDTCHTDASPMWWSIDSSSFEKNPESIQKFLCQTCYHSSKSLTDSEDQDDQNEEAKQFIATINQPLTGEQFGLIDNNDTIGDVIDPLQLHSITPIK